MSDEAMTTTVPRSTYWRATGPWLVLAAAGYLLTNVLRVFLDEAGFARYFGLEGDDNGWLYVYASRTTLLAAVALILLARRDLRLLSIYAGCTILGPISDAILVAQHNASPGTVLRHLATALFLLLTATLLFRQHCRAA